MLAHHGFVQQEPVTRAYIAGPALVEVGLAVVGSLNVREQARPVMEELAAELGETVHLGVLEGNQVRYVDAVESERALRVVARTGTWSRRTARRWARPCSPDDRRSGRQAVPQSAEPFAARTERSITTQAKLLKEVSRARARGYAVNSGETEDDVGSVAVAFRDFADALPPSRWPHPRVGSAQRISRIGDLMIEAIARTPESTVTAQAPAE